jgi:hypothetical protein
VGADISLVDKFTGFKGDCFSCSGTTVCSDPSEGTFSVMFIKFGFNGSFAAGRGLLFPLCLIGNHGKEQKKNSKSRQW